MSDATDETIVYARSEEFEVRAGGSPSFEPSAMPMASRESGSRGRGLGASVVGALACVVASVAVAAVM